MTIEQFRGQHTPGCDSCGAELKTEFSFNEALAAMQRAGWKSEKQEDGTYRHICSVCLHTVRDVPEAQGGGDGPHPAQATKSL